MINRRKFLEAGAAVGVGVMLPVKVAKAAEKMARQSGAAMPPGGGGSPTLTKWLDPLPIPGVYARKAMVGNMPFYEIPITAFTQTLHSELKPTHLWGYGGTYPSASIEAVVGQPISVRWRNDLIIPNPSRGIIGNPHPVLSGIDRVNIAGVDGFPDQRISTHLHGAHVPWQSDGGPKGWYTTGKNPMTYPVSQLDGDPFKGINFFNGDTFTYPNDQLGTTLWFHDHTMGITRLNVMAGLAGFYLLRDPNEGTLNLPSGKYEIPLAIQDRTFNPATTTYPFNDLFYPAPPEVPEFFGDTMLVNGKVWPFLNVEARKYRFRILDGCNARFLRMQLVVTTPDGAVPSTRNWVNVPWVQIGAEGGFLPAPTDPFNVLLMGPGERADVIIDFTKFAGQTILMFNDASTPFGNTQDTRGAIPQVMIFRVGAATTDNSVIPASFAGFTDAGTFSPPSDAQHKFKSLDEKTLPNGMLIQLINQVGYEVDPFSGNYPSNNPPDPKGCKFVDPDVAILGTTEIWEYINTTVDVHPIHTHQTMFKVLSRQPFTVSQYQAKRGSGAAIDPTPFLKQDQLTGPAPNETGWKDTVKANPGEVTRIAIRWDGPASGHYVYHCHILEHEEHDMMRSLDVLASQ